MAGLITANIHSILLAAVLATGFCGFMQPLHKRRPWFVAAILLCGLTIII